MIKAPQSGSRWPLLPAVLGSSPSPLMCPEASEEGICCSNSAICGIASAQSLALWVGLKSDTQTSHLEQNKKGADNMTFVFFAYNSSRAAAVLSLQVTQSLSELFPLCLKTSLSSQWALPASSQSVASWYHSANQLVTSCGLIRSQLFCIMLHRFGYNYF